MRYVNITQFGIGLVRLDLKTRMIKYNMRKAGGKEGVVGCVCVMTI